MLLKLADISQDLNTFAGGAAVAGAVASTRKIDKRVVLGLEGASGAAWLASALASYHHKRKKRKLTKKASDPFWNAVTNSNVNPFASGGKAWGDIAYNVYDFPRRAYRGARDYITGAGKVTDDPRHALGKLNTKPRGSLKGKASVSAGSGHGVGYGTGAAVAGAGALGAIALKRRSARIAARNAKIYNRGGRYGKMALMAAGAMGLGALFREKDDAKKYITKSAEQDISLLEKKLITRFGYLPPRLKGTRLTTYLRSRER